MKISNTPPTTSIKARHLPSTKSAASRSMLAWMLFAISITAFPMLRAAEPLDLLSDEFSLSFAKQYGGLAPQHDLADGVLHIKWEPNPRQTEAPYSGGGFSIELPEAINLKGASLFLSAHGTSGNGEGLSGASISVFDDEGVRSEVHFLPAPGTDESAPVEIVCDVAGDTKRGFRYEKGEGNISKAKKIVVSFSVPGAQSGETTVTAISLTPTN